MDDRSRRRRIHRQALSIALALVPFGIVFGVACAGIVVEAFVPRRGRFRTQVVLTLAGLATAPFGWNAVTPVDPT